MTSLDELMTVDEVAELLRVPRSTINGWARAGILPSIKLGRHRRFVRADMVEAIEQLRLQSRPGTRRSHTHAPVGTHSGTAARR